MPSPSQPSIYPSIYAAVAAGGCFGLAGTGVWRDWNRSGPAPRHGAGTSHELACRSGWPSYARQPLDAPELLMVAPDGVAAAVIFPTPQHLASGLASQPDGLPHHLLHGGALTPSPRSLEPEGPVAEQGVHAGDAHQVHRDTEHGAEQVVGVDMAQRKTRLVHTDLDCAVQLLVGAVLLAELSDTAQADRLGRDVAPVIEHAFGRQAHVAVEVNGAMGVAPGATHSARLGTVPRAHGLGRCCRRAGVPVERQARLPDAMMPAYAGPSPVPCVISAEIGGLIVNRSSAQVPVEVALDAPRHLLGSLRRALQQALAAEAWSDAQQQRGSAHAGSLGKDGFEAVRARAPNAVRSGSAPVAVCSPGSADRPRATRSRPRPHRCSPRLPWLAVAHRKGVDH